MATNEFTTYANLDHEEKILMTTIRTIRREVENRAFIAKMNPDDKTVRENLEFSQERLTGCQDRLRQLRLAKAKRTNGNGQAAKMLRVK